MPRARPRAGSRNLWAPDISFRNGQFYLYYSASTFGSQRSAIFLATNPTGAAGSWTDRGLVIESSSAVNYNAIDRNLVVDANGQWWLAFGSFWSGIKLIRLDPATGRRSTSDTTVRALATRPSSAGGAIEAPFNYADADVLFYHYYADNGASLLGINLIGWDAAGWPFVY